MSFLHTLIIVLLLHSMQAYRADHPKCDKHRIESQCPIYCHITASLAMCAPPRDAGHNATAEKPDVDKRYDEHCVVRGEATAGDVMATAPEVFAFLSNFAH